ncbi:TRAP transporter small permease [Paracoccus sp. (in: a-proteobacteria)]|uniref:TRAP transporter small permease n=1 Tax=Paracoccus sp. TaxID=267 RepID=UPI003A86DCA2
MGQHGSAGAGPVWLRAISGLSSALNRIAAGGAAILLVLMVGLILVEIVMRFFSKSTFMTDVLVGYGVAAITFLAMGWTLEQGSMIRISAVTARLNPVMRLMAEALAVIATGILTIWLMGFVWRTMSRMWVRGTTSEHYLPIPLWIPEAFFFAGLALLVLHLLVRLLRLAVFGHDGDDILNL